MSDAKRLFWILAYANFLLFFGYEIWQDIFNNFAVEQLGVNATQIGLLQSLREIPGLLGFVLAFLVLWLSEMRVMGLSVLLLGLGLVVSGWAQGLGVLVVGTMIMSTGFHFFYPSSASVLLMETSQEEAPKFLGYVRSISALAAFLAALAILLLVKGAHLGPLNLPAWGYRRLLVVTGAAIVAGSLLLVRNGRGSGALRERRRIIFRRGYWLYYALTFLMGSRRHIFTTFAIFLLVQVYQIDVRLTAVLFLTNNLVNTFTSALFGRMVARFGERKVLTVNFLGLMGVFLGYAFVPYLPVLCVLFVLDSVFFGFSLAVDSYFQKISISPEEITSNVSLAQTINHISALVVPVLGGLLWSRVSPSSTFLAGVAIVAVAMGLVQFMQVRPAAVPAAAAGD